jgi:hypothetical protein
MNARDVDFAERAAILEFDGGLSRAEAEKQALAEIYNVTIEGIPPGAFGELIIADRVRRNMRVNGEAEATFGHVRFPWGFGWVVAHDKGYRPAKRDEQASAAFVVPAVANGCVVDLVAQTFALKGIRTRLGAAAAVGADDIEAAKENGQPLYVFSSIPQWLKGGGRGAVIVDWHRAAHELDGVPAILCSSSVSDRLYAVTRQCVPVPVIATPSNNGARHAA